MGVDAQMFVKTGQEYTVEQVGKLAHDLAEAFGHGRFNIARPGEYPWWPEGQHCLELVACYEQDGPPIRPEAEEQIIEVHLSVRYYGKGYERGDWPFIDAVARWLEARIPDAEVWYGGDSSGVLASPIREHRRDLWALFCGVGHVPYVHYFSRASARPTCDFCLAPMPQFSWGPNDRAGFSCHGCGHRLFTDDGGKTFYEPPKGDQP